MAAIFTVGAAPAWARSDHDAMTFQATAPYIRAEQWIVTHIPANARLITDDTMWVDLTTRKFGTESQRGGFYSAHVVWFWKLGTDPAVDRRFPQSWRDFNYIISTPTLRATVQQALPALAALQHSIVVKRFGRSPSVPGNPTMTDPGTPLSQQPDRIEIRLIEPNR